jgi:hypothetical protein
MKRIIVNCIYKNRMDIVNVTLNEHNTTHALSKGTSKM